VLLLFAVTVYCLLGMLATAQLSAYDDPTTERRAYMWLAGAALFGGVAVWQFVVLLLRRRENQP
jgi:NO-binding membrane sensor protein with MHYT domain